MMTLGDRLTEQECDYMLSVVDRDGDGSISYREFADMMLAKIKV